MNERLMRQEEYKVSQKLVYENIRRVLFASLICVFAIPVLMLVNYFFPISPELSGLVKGFLTGAELVSVAFIAISFFAMRSREQKMMRMVYRSFWLFFEAFAFIIIYADTMGGSRLGYYAVMLSVLLLVPIMTVSELMYYMVIQTVYVVFLSVKFGTTANDVFNLVVLNAVLFAASRIIYGLQRERLVLREKVKSVKDGAMTDPMTRLLNRKGLEKKVYSYIGQCIKDRRRISVLMIDIDDMKWYNSDFGNERGDECIKSVASVISQVVLRNTDVVCRLSGGKFLVYMEGGNDMEPLSLAEKVRTTIERKRIPQSRRAANPFVTVSIGVASVIPRGESDFSEIYDEAEDSLYEAKERGKNITVYDEQIYGQFTRKAT